MKNRLLILCAILLSAGGVSAQMPTAQRIPPAVEKTIILNAPIGEVWAYVSDMANYKEFSGVREFWYEGKKTGSKIRVTGREGVERDQTLSMKFDEFHRLAFEVKESGYGLSKSMHILFELKPADNNQHTELVMSVMFGFDPLPDNARKDMELEFDDIAAGLSGKFSSGLSEYHKNS